MENAALQQQLRELEAAKEELEDAVEYWRGRWHASCEEADLLRQHVLGGQQPQPQLQPVPGQHQVPRSRVLCGCSSPTSACVR